MSTDPTAETQVAGFAEAASPAVVGERFEILGLLGAGGMGNVYKARDRELDEIVAIKVLRPELLGDADALERFRREVKLARRITHPNVARVFDIGERGGERILTMELVDGEPLSARLAREGRLPVAAVVEIASALCAGLSAAHAAGVLHRDLKPDNVLLEKGGRVVITDFGIARPLDAGAAVTGALVGTPAYMAPEQIEGSPVDARTDLYALGAMLFELATGELPFAGETIFAVAAARLLQPPPDPRRLRPDLPPGLAALIQRAMARRREDRFATAAEVAAELSTLTLPAPAPLGRPAPAAPLAASPPAKKRVAVLPFRNAGPPEHAYVAEGLTEDVIDALSMVPGLRVRSRGVVMRYRDLAGDPREVGRELDVQVVVDGTVRRTPAGVRVSARLASVADGVQLWARRFDRPDAELLQVSDDVARAIAEALTLDLGAAAGGGEADARAMDLYLRARAVSHRFFSELAATALPLFEQAMARAPNDPRILAGYAMARARVGTDDPEAARAASAAAQRAVALGPGLPHAHVALATVAYQAGEEVGPVRSLKHALRLSPEHPDAHGLLGRILGETPLLTEAARHLRTSLALEPEGALNRIALARVSELLGDPDEADRLLAEPIAETTALLGRLLMWRRDPERARRILGAGPPLTPLARAFLEVAAGAPPPYVLLAPSGLLTPRVSSFFHQMEAELAANAGDRGRALAALARAVDGTLYDVAWTDRCPVLADLRTDPVFLALRATVAARAGRAAAAYLEPSGA